MKRSTKVMMAGWLVSCGLSLGVYADGVPLTGLLDSASVKSDSGTWALEKFTNRNQLPYPTDVQPIAKFATEQGSDAGSDFGDPHHRVVIFHDRVLINNNGRSGQGDDWNWASFVSFTPTAPGKYTLAGDATFEASSNGSTMTYLVFKLDKDKNMVVIAQGNAKPGDTVKLSDLKDASGKPVSSVDLKAGQRIGITAWQSAEWNWGDTNIKGIEIKKAS